MIEEEAFYLDLDEEYDGPMPKPLVAALDMALGYLERRPASYLMQELDRPEVFPVTHERFRGQLTTRDEFNYFGAWLEVERLRNPKILMQLDDMIPRIRVTLH